MLRFLQPWMRGAEVGEKEVSHMRKGRRCQGKGDGRRLAVLLLADRESGGGHVASERAERSRQRPREWDFPTTTSMGIGSQAVNGEYYIFKASCDEKRRR